MRRWIAGLVLLTLALGAPALFGRAGGGCFLGETPVLLADGSTIAIADLQPGLVILAFDADGRTVPARVARVFTHRVDRHLILRTAGVALRVTTEHPFYTGPGTFRSAGTLLPGELLWRHDGAEGLTARPILAIEEVMAPATVYNLQTEGPHTYFAGGIAVHNKGEGGYSSRSESSSSSRSSSSDYGSDRSSSRDGSSSNGGNSTLALIMLGLFAWSFIHALATGNVRVVKDGESSRPSGASAGVQLDHCYTRREIEAKATKTRVLLEFITKVDPAWEPDGLRNTATKIFRRVQEAWTKRDCGPVADCMMADLHEQHRTQLRGMELNQEFNRLEDLTVEAVDVVHVNYTLAKTQRWFTALITAHARDHYVDAITGNFIRGDRESARFQEFWTFHFTAEGWKLREIEQTRESDALTEENFFEQFTDLGRDQIYGAAAGQSGPAGPALPAPVLEKEDKIRRLLNFLVQTDPIWNRDEMLATARRVYLNVMLGWQDGRPGSFAGTPLAPALAQQLERATAANQHHGLRIEYRNLCVRKAELVHVHNSDDRRTDEFTVRINAHAQRRITQGELVLHHDPDVRAWVDFWTFGRDDRRWVLKEILPESAGASALQRENFDEGTDLQMLEWYYSKSRAT